MSELNIRKEKEGQVCYVEIRNPAKRNALNLKLINQLASVFQNFNKDSEVRVVVLSGYGLHFCAGGDLEWMKLKQDASDIENLNELSLLYKLFYNINRCPVPVIASVQGAVYGGGIGLLAASDIAVATEDAKFCFSELKIGLIPALISPFVLKKMAFSKAQFYMLSAKIFSAEEALSSGLIHFVGTRKARTTCINDLITSFLNFDKTALKKTKDLLRFVPENSMEKTKSYCIEALAERRKSPEVLKRINRFLNKK